MEQVIRLFLIRCRLEESRLVHFVDLLGQKWFWYLIHPMSVEVETEKADIIEVPVPEF